MAFLAFAFIVIPLLELFLLVQIASGIGVLSTVALCVVTGIAGAALARHEGLRTLARVQRSLAEGRMPESELVDGMLILFAAAVLLTPGVLTDLLGFLLLIPWSRAWLKRGAVAALQHRVQLEVVRPGGRPDRSRPGSRSDEPESDGRSRAGSKVIDVDFTVKDGD